MQETKRNILVGGFMMSGLAALGALMIIFGEQPGWLGGAEYELQIRFREVSGVTGGMPINLNGVQIGRVDRMEFEDLERPGLGVRVIGLIKDQYLIPSLAKAEVTPGLLGLGRGNITLIVPEIATNPLDKKHARIDGVMGNPFGDVIPETLAVSIEETAIHIGNLAEAATPLATDLHHLFEIRSINQVDAPGAAAAGITANLYTLIQRFDLTVGELNGILADPEFKPSVLNAVSNFERMTVEGREAMITMRRMMDQLETDTSSIAQKLDSGLSDANKGINEILARMIPALDQLSELMVNLNSVSRDLAQGGGTAGLLLRDDRMYESFVLSIQRLTDALDVIRRIAERFENQGFIEFKSHDVAGPIDYQGKYPIPPNTE